MNASTITLVASGIVLLGSAIFSGPWFSSRSEQTVTEYFLMSKQLRARTLGAAFVAADMSVATVVLALATVGYVYGFLGVLWITLCWLAGICLFLRIVSWPIFLDGIRKGHTLHEIIGSQYDSDGSRTVRLLASVVTILTFFMTVGIEFFAGFVVFHSLPGSPSPFSIALILALSVTLYTVWGGFRGTTRVNVWRLGLILFTLLSLGILTILFQIRERIPVDHTFYYTPGLSFTWIIAVGLTLVPAQVAAMDMWQRCAAAEGNYFRIKRGLLASMPLYAVWLIPGFLGAMGRFLVNTTNRNYIALDVIHRVVAPLGGWWPYLGQPLMYAGFVAIIGCTTDTLLNAMTFTFINDFYPVFKGGVDVAHLDAERSKTLVSTAKLWSALLGLGSLSIFFVGLLWATIYDLVVALFSVQVLLFCPVLFIIVGKRRSLAMRSKWAVTGLVGGMAIAFGVLVVAGILGLPDLMSLAPLLALGFAALCFGVACISAPKKAMETPGAVQ